MRPPPRRAPSPTVAGPAQTVPALWSVAVGILFGALYVALAAPVWGGKDAGEFALVLAVGGAAHPTGYPLFTLAGHAFVILLHRFGVSWPYAANLWSAVGAAVAMALFHALGARIVPPAAAAGRLGRATLALIATAIVGFDPAWLLDAMLAEVYSWHLAWVCVAGLVALASIRAMAAGESSTPWTPRRLAAAAAGWGLVCGVGLAHHVTALLFIVPLSVAIALAAARGRLWRAWLPAVAIVAALVPLASYAFIVHRAYHPAAFQWPVLQPSLPSVVAHVTGAEYRDLLGRWAPNEVQRDLFRRAIYPVLFPALAALMVAAVRARAGAERLALGALVAAAVFQTAYGFSYGVSDPSSYFEPSLAVGLLAVPLLGSALLRRPRQLPAAGVLAGAGVIALGMAWLPFGFAVRQGAVILERQVRQQWRSLPDDGAIVLWRHDMVPVLRGYQLLEGEKPGLYVQDPYALTYPGPRGAFATRFGFDPLEGLSPITAAKLALIPETINRQTALPVFLFDQSTTRPLAKTP